MGYANPNANPNVARGSALPSLQGYQALNAGVNRALTTPAGQAAPTIADLVGQVARNNQMAAAPAPAAPYMAQGGLPAYDAEQMRQAALALARGRAMQGSGSIADVIRQVRMLQGV